MRLLWLIDSLTQGGAEALVPRFAKALDPAVSFEVCCLKTIGGNPNEEPLRAAGIPVTNLHARRLLDRRAFSALRALLRDREIDVLHAHLTYATIWGVLAGRRERVPVVATLHLPPLARGLRDRVRQRLLAALLSRGAAATVAVSESLRDSWLRSGALSRRRFPVIHNGIDVERFARARPAAERRALPDAAKVVTTVAVLRPGKGIDVLLEAAGSVRRRLPEATFWIVGDGPLRAGLEAQARRLGLHDAVRFLGQRSDVDALLAASDLFVLPSLHDAFPTALLEAMAAGVPALASRTGGIPEILGEGCGLMVPPGDAAALASGIERLLRSGDALGEQRQRALHRVSSRFSAGSWVERLMQLYESALAEASPAGAAR